MPDNYYNSAGSAASDRIQEYLVMQQQQRRQDMLDQLAIRKQQADDARQNRKMDMEQEQHQADLALKRDQLISSAHEREARTAELQQAGLEKQKTGLSKRFEQMVPGDIPDAEMVKQADSLGIGTQNFPKPPMTQQSMPGLVAPNSPLISPQMRIAPAPVSASGVGPNAGSTNLPPSPEPPAQVGLTGVSDSSVRPYIGTRQDREKQAAEHELDAYASSLPDGPIKQVIEAKRHGVTITAGDLKQENPTPEGRDLMLDPQSRKYQDANGNVVTNPGKADRVHVLPIHDTSARDAAHEQANERLMEQIRQHAYTTFDATAKPYEEEIRNVQKLNTVLNQNSNVADATIAEQVLKMTAGGAGSGLRLTQPLIDQILHSRSKWDDLQLALNRWDGQPGSLSLTPEQKISIRALGKGIIEKASGVHKKILDARTAVDNPSANAATIHKAVTDLKDSLYSPTDESGSAAPATSGAPRIRYDMNGNRLP